MVDRWPYQTAAERSALARGRTLGLPTIRAAVHPKNTVDNSASRVQSASRCGNADSRVFSLLDIHVTAPHCFRYLTNISHNIPLQPRQRTFAMARILHYTQLFHGTATYLPGRIRIVPHLPTSKLHTYFIPSR